MDYFRPTVILLPLALGVASSASAAPPAAQVPQELAKAARTILETYCGRCHGEKSSAEGGFKTVTDRAKLIARKKIIPGDASNSPLMERIVGGEMPPAEEKKRPSAADIAVLTRWVKAGAPDWALPTERKFITVHDEAKLVREDLEKYKADPAHQALLRYFTLTPLYNAGCSDDELQTTRLGLTKLLNSFSWQKDIIIPETINPERTIVRLDLKAFGWNRLHWESFTRFGPYHMAYRPDKNKHPEAMPVRADWFVADASKPPRYHWSLGIPRTVRELESKLKVNAAENIRDTKVIRAAFNQSGVSRNNRMIERHTGAHGYYWKSYDFASSRGRRNVLTYPLGPAPSEDGTTFQQDGGEIIFRLPNGLQGYMLIDGRGNTLERGPTEIVSDPKHPDRVVENGISCMSCHAAGFIDKADQVRTLVAEANFTAEQRKQILGLYPPRETFQAALKADAADYRAALKKMEVQAEEAEPISATARRFESDLDIRQAAAELWLTPEEFRACLKKMPAHQSGELVALLPAGATLKRDTFELRFRNALYWCQKAVESTAQTFEKRGVAKATRTVVPLQGDLYQLAEFQPITYRSEPSVPPTIDPTFQRFVTVSKDEARLLIFDLKAGAAGHTLPVQRRVVALTFSNDGSRLAASGEDSFIRFFDPRTGKEVANTTEADQGDVSRYNFYALAFSPDGKEFAAPGRNGTIRFVNPATGRPLRTIPEPDTRIVKLLYSPDARLLLSADSRGGAVRATDLMSGKTQQIDRGDGRITSMSFSPKGRFLFLTFSNNTIRFRDAKTFDEVGFERVAFEGSKDWASTVRTAVFSGDEKYLAAAHTAGAISVWSADTLRLLGVIQAYPHDVLRTLRFSPDNKRLASGASDGSVRIWDVDALLKGGDEK